MEGMKRARAREFGVGRQRGFWLRYFLGFVTLITLLVGTVIGAHAQVAAPAPYHLSHLRGVYVDEKGNPIVGAAVSLEQNDKPIYTTQTDRTGKFEIKHVSGHYWLHVQQKGYPAVHREVIVGLEAVSYLHGDVLYIIAGPAACSDDCSQIYTSKEKFDKAIRRNTGHTD
jgi:hypothetical protein